VKHLEEGASLELILIEAQVVQLLPILNLLPLVLEFVLLYELAQVYFALFASGKVGTVLNESDPSVLRLILILIALKVILSMILDSLASVSLLRQAKGTHGLHVMELAL
jgi:hypothetical protein